MINLSVEYPGQITAPSGGYPSGSAKNETSPGALDGTPYELRMADDIFGFQQALIKAAGITLSGNADTALASQQLQGILHQVYAGFVFVDSGAADAYVLSPITNNQGPHAYKDRARFVFYATNTNTGASTANISTLGNKDIFFNGAALTADDITVNQRITIEFDLANDRFNLIPTDILDHLTLIGNATSPPKANTLVKDNLTKGWINFDGTGTIAIRDDYNVSSIVDLGVGNYTINMDTDFADANYGIFTGSNAQGEVFITSQAVGSFIIQVLDSTGTPFDASIVSLQMMGAQT